MAAGFSNARSSRAEAITLAARLNLRIFTFLMQYQILIFFSDLANFSLFNLGLRVHTRGCSIQKQSRRIHG